ncbi:hypothetical protein SCLCIDRAFT_1216976 [Scleroderma citrinum Foug A]|uniref:Uncharacterized protein n=1 Tax=Scleroderma citrinum Foug A TaxID=1036808 RepID=A0A0C3DVK0_9AGAM|nr:hypothetical protein SCLCIDRAFT_1216976 [Scleroderma citrinum Foug A]
MSQVVAAGSRTLNVGNPFESYYDGPGHTIIGAENAIRALHDFQEKVKRIKTEIGDVLVYESESANDIKTIVINIGPLEIDISIDLDNYSIMVEVYLNIIFTKVQIAKAGGSLKDGVTLSIGYPGILSGSLTFKTEGSDVVLYYDFTAFGYRYSGKIVII